MLASINMNKAEFKASFLHDCIDRPSIFCKKYSNNARKFIEGNVNKNLPYFLTKNRTYFILNS